MCFKSLLGVHVIVLQIDESEWETYEKEKVRKCIVCKAVPWYGDFRVFPFVKDNDGSFTQK